MKSPLPSPRATFQRLATGFAVSSLGVAAFILLLMLTGHWKF